MIAGTYPRILGIFRQTPTASRGSRHFFLSKFFSYLNTCFFTFCPPVFYWVKPNAAASSRLDAGSIQRPGERSVMQCPAVDAGGKGGKSACTRDTARRDSEAAAKVEKLVRRLSRPDRFPLLFFVCAHHLAERIEGSCRAEHSGRVEPP